MQLVFVFVQLFVVLAVTSLVFATSVVAQGDPTAAKRVPSATVKRADPPPAPPGNDQKRLLALTEQLNENTIAVVSGNINGTYLSLAYDLSAVLDDGDRLRVLPIVGKGAYQNLIDLLHLRGVDLAITQSDVLSYVKQKGDMGPNIDQRISYIAKLYNEEMHVLAGPGVKALRDLEGRKVNFSDNGSGTQFTARLIFDLLKIRVTEINVGQADGYQMVKSGDIAATILFAGKPAIAFSKFVLEPGMNLLPVPYYEVLESDYFPAKLTSDDYPNIIEKGKTVETIAVGAVLATYNWPKDTDRYRRNALFTERFFERLSDLQRAPRHPKWRETNLGAALRGWRRFPAAEQWLAKPQKPMAQPAINPDLIRSQAAELAPNDPAAQEKLVREFFNWYKAQQQK